MQPLSTDGSTSNSQQQQQEDQLASQSRMLYSHTESRRAAAAAVAQLFSFCSMKNEHIYTQKKNRSIQKTFTIQLAADDD